MAEILSSGLGQRPTVYRSSIERRLTSAFRSVRRVSAETPCAIVSFCTELPPIGHPGKLQHPARSRPLRVGVSDALRRRPAPNGQYEYFASWPTPPRTHHALPFAVFQFIVSAPSARFRPRALVPPRVSGICGRRPIERLQVQERVPHREIIGCGVIEQCSCFFNRGTTPTVTSAEL